MLRRRNSQTQAFTLIEMTVVIAIIILLAGLVLPAATQLWRDRKITDAQNMVSGMLMTARARAIQSQGAQTGLLFFVDGQGYQRVQPISQNPNTDHEDAARTITGWQSDPRWYNVFTVQEGGGFTLPSPMRISPLYVICSSGTDPGICASRPNYQLFLNDELKDPDVRTVAIDNQRDTGQLHRNFFTLIFDPNGEMRVGRDVLIRDVDQHAEDKGPPDSLNSGGFNITGLPTTNPPPDSPIASYYRNDSSNAAKNSITGTGAMRLVTGVSKDWPPDWLFVDSTKTAVNFPSVDGLLVYDDSLFNEAGDATAKRQFLKDHGLPFYINRITGAVVRGPAGETP